MKQKLIGKIYVILVLTVVLFLSSLHAGRFFGIPFAAQKSEESAAMAFTVEEAQKLLTDAKTLEYLSADEAVVLDASSRRIGRLLHTQPLAKHIIGYGSYLPIVIGIDAEDKITGLLLQKNDETPGFIKRLNKLGFFDSWNGHQASEAVNLPVDAVSRATMTSRATIESLRLRLAEYVKVEQIRRQIDYRALAVEVAAWAFLLLAFSGCFAAARLAKYRKIYLLFAILVPGFMLGRFFSVELLYNWAINGIPLSSQLFMAVLVALAIVIPLLSGRSWYCTWYCPYGAAQELIGYACAKKFDPTGRAAHFARYLRPAFLFLIAMLLITGVRFSLNSVEPFSAFLLASASQTVLILAGVFLAISLIIRRPWCNYFCPSGQIVEMLRVGIADKQEKPADGEAHSMKIHAVLNVLLAIAIIILLMSPARIGNNGEFKPAQLTKNEVDKMPGSSTVSVSSMVPVASQAVSVATNPTLATIYERKSVRSFTGEPVSREMLTELVKAGMAAPTARNRQPWQFIVISEKPAMLSLAEKLPYAKMLASAGAAIVVCGDLEIARAGDTESMWMLDCSAATQNILLAAESMGLGAVWTAAFPYADRIAAVNEVVKLPEYVVPLCVIPVGRPTGSDRPKDKWKPERLHWEHFSPASGAAEVK